MLQKESVYDPNRTNEDASSELSAQQTFNRAAVWVQLPRQKAVEIPKSVTAPVEKLVEHQKTFADNRQSFESAYLTAKARSEARHTWVDENQDAIIALYSALSASWLDDDVEGLINTIYQETDKNIRAFVMSMKVFAAGKEHDDFGHFLKERYQDHPEAERIKKAVETAQTDFPLPEFEDITVTANRDMLPALPEKPSLFARASGSFRRAIQGEIDQVTKSDAEQVKGFTRKINAAQSKDEQLFVKKRDEFSDQGMALSAAMQIRKASLGRGEGLADALENSLPILYKSFSDRDVTKWMTSPKDGNPPLVRILIEAGDISIAQRLKDFDRALAVLPEKVRRDITENMLTSTDVWRRDLLREAVEQKDGNLALAIQDSLGALVKRFGDGEVAEWLMAAPEGDSSLLIKAITDTEEDLEGRLAALDYALEPFKGTTRKLILMTMQDQTQGWQQDIFRIKHLQRVNDLVPVGELAYFNPKNTGFANYSEKEGGLRVSPFGKKQTIRGVTEDEAVLVSDALCEFHGFYDDGNDEPKNPSMVRSLFYRDGTYYTDIAGNGWNRKIKEEKAQEIMAKRAAAQKDLVALPNGSHVNRARVDHAWISKDEESGTFTLTYVADVKTSECKGIKDQKTAGSLLKTLSDFPSRVMATSTEMIDLARICNAWIVKDEKDGNKSQFKFGIDGKSYFVDISYQKAQTLLQTLERDYGHISVAENETIGPDNLSMIWFKKAEGPKEKDRLCYVTRDDTWGTAMSAEDAKAVMEKIETRSNFIRYENNGIMNLDRIARLSRDGDNLKILTEAGERWTSETNMPVLEHISENKAFSWIGGPFFSMSEKSFINLNLIDMAEYNEAGSRLEYSIAGKRDFYNKMTAHEARQSIRRILDWGARDHQAALKDAMDSFDHAAMKADSGVLEVPEALYIGAPDDNTAQEKAVAHETPQDTAQKEKPKKAAAAHEPNWKNVL